MTSYSPHPASFRDKSGSVFFSANEVFRTINNFYKENYSILKSSGLYSELIKKDLLIQHREIKDYRNRFKSEGVYKIIKPRLIPFISYPFEWCHSQLMEAALLTLEIEKISLGYGMTLKDATAYNVQFEGYKPVFIDTLSFEKNKEDSPWIPYRQFCQQFLVPLALSKYKDLHLGKLSRIYLDGIDLSLAVKLLPVSSFHNFHLLLHIFLHRLSQKHLKVTPFPVRGKKYSLDNKFNMIESLQSAVSSLTRKKQNSFWSGYYQDNNYSLASFESKSGIIGKIARGLKPGLVADLGANTGFYSRLVSSYSRYVISMDIDPQSVEESFQLTKKEKIKNIINIIADLTNPSPAIGWRNQERYSLLERLKVDSVLALALSHHLFFSHNISFEFQAKFFASMAENLIIEFIPISDNQIRELIRFRSESFADYTKDNFIKCFTRYFLIKKHFPIKDSIRSVFYLKRKS